MQPVPDIRRPPIAEPSPAGNLRLRVRLLGTSCQEMPLQSTMRVPVRTGRSGTRGRRPIR